MKRKIYNYAQTRDGRLEVAYCPDQRRGYREDLDKQERGPRSDARRSYWDMVKK